ncbi:MAG TPA: hypothetical protein VMY42_06475 [Thermoguttaceae bacterium]|nr:hypothetical protein [Thermoguttaceae bacterium]
MEFFLIIFPLILEAIMQCQENRNDDDIVEGLVRPGEGQAVALLRILRQDIYRDGILIHKGLRGVPLVNQTRKGIRRLKKMSRADVVGMVAEAAAHRAAGTSPAAIERLTCSSFVWGGVADGISTPSL